VESLAQLGVQLLLFHLGRELSFSKLKAVWSVALVGGALQIVALSAFGGVVAAVLESPVNQVRHTIWGGGGVVSYTCRHVRHDHSGIAHPRQSTHITED
jgi:Kef-type K+ transport system membrane component KefB